MLKIAPNHGLIRTELIDGKRRLDIYWNNENPKSIVGIFYGYSTKNAHLQMNQACKENGCIDYNLVSLHRDNSMDDDDGIAISLYCASFSNLKSLTLTELEDMIGTKLSFTMSDILDDDEKLSLKSDVFYNMCTIARDICENLNKIPNLTAEPKNKNGGRAAPFQRLEAFKQSLTPVSLSFREDKIFYEQPVQKLVDGFYEKAKYPDYFLPMTDHLMSNLKNLQQIFAARDKQGNVFVSISSIVEALPYMAIEASEMTIPGCFDELEMKLFGSYASHVMWTLFFSSEKNYHWIEYKPDGENLLPT